MGWRNTSLINSTLYQMVSVVTLLRWHSYKFLLDLFLLFLRYYGCNLSVHLPKPIWYTGGRQNFTWHSNIERFRVILGSTKDMSFTTVSFTTTVESIQAIRLPFKHKDPSTKVLVWLCEQCVIYSTVSRSTFMPSLLKSEQEKRVPFICAWKVWVSSLFTTKGWRRTPLSVLLHLDYITRLVVCTLRGLVLFVTVKTFCNFL